jgi:hypothetical protein
VGLEIQEAGVGLGKSSVGYNQNSAFGFFSLSNPSSCKLEDISFLSEGGLYV